MEEVTRSFRGRRVLVTGCTGLLGSAVVRTLLAGGVDVVGLIREHRTIPSFNFERLPGRFHALRGRTENSFRIYSALAIHEAAAVFHLAAQETLDDRGTHSVLGAALRYDARMPVVMACPSHSTARTTVGDTPCAGALGIARFGELFGPGDRKAFHVVPSSILCFIAGERMKPGPDDATTDYVYAKDAARAVMLLAEALAEQPAPTQMDVAFRSGWTLTPREMGTMVRDVYENRITHVSVNPVPSNPFGWSPSNSCWASLSETIAWFRQFHRHNAIGMKPFDSTRRAAA